VLSSRLAGRRMIAAAALIFSAASVGSPAHGQGRFEARYSVTIAGIPVGQGVWVADIAEDQYSTAASGRVTGIARVLSDGEGSGTARGRVNAGRLLPSTYAVTVTADRRPDEIRMGFAGGAVKELRVEPPTPYSADRVPLTEAHRRGVSDPMTASLVRVAGNGDPVAPQACQRTSSVFDGRMRYDLRFAFKRVEPVHAEKGYAGPAVVCAVYFSPIAGHIPDRAAIKYLAELRDMELWLAPIAGTRVMVPYRVTVPTPLGVGVLQATQFVSVPQPGKASAKTQ
jgi:Protein of unknown function (DUF3108)